MRVLAYIIWFFIGIAIGVLVIALSRGVEPAILLGILVTPFLAILVHEAGHLLAGLAAGMKPVFVSAGPFALYWRHRRRPRLRLVPLLFGGFTFCVPRRDQGIRTQMIAMTAGGPLASLALAVAAAAFWFSSDDPLRFPVAFLGIISALLFTGSAIPYAEKGMSSDGAKIRMLMRNGANARALCASLTLIGAAWRGAPPARWPREAIEVALAAEPGSPERVSGLQFAYCIAADLGDEELAAGYLDATLEASAGMSEAITAPAAREAAIFHLFVRRGARTARELFEGQKPALLHETYVKPLIEAGLAAADGDRETAMILARKARTALERALFPGWAALHARWLARLEAELAAPA